MPASVPWILAVVGGGSIVAGCGSNWQIRKGDELPYGCEQLLFYPDADRDGWGDPNGSPIESCQPEAQFDASNGRDCTDDDPAITGQVGSVCPDGLVAGGSEDYAGVLGDEVEYVYVYGTTPVTRYTMATSACEGWSGSVREEGGEWTPRGSLATFGSRAELEAIQAEIEGVVGVGGVYAGFIGIEWDGSLADEDAWSWIDDSDDSLFDQVGFCDGAPGPADFFPNLNPDDPDHVGGLTDEVDRVRLALVLREDGSWCLGLPSDAVPGSGGSQTDAHFVCERPTPATEDYEELVGS